MRKEIAPELYNYNKFPGPEFKFHGNQVFTEKISFDMVENYREAFDVTAFNQRFSEILTKFDYIVGDWGNEQLRLRGFYKDTKSVDAAQKISRLEDYILEYCNFGCAYFVLENHHPKRAAFDKKSHAKKKDEKTSHSHKQGEARKSREKKPYQKRERHSQAVKAKSKTEKVAPKQEKQAKDKNRHFVIRQK